MRLAIAVPAAALVLTAVTFAQEPPRRDVFRATATMVRVDVVVTDKDGRSVPDLTAADFEIVENGRVQEIAQVRYMRLPPRAPAPKADVQAPAAPTRLKSDEVRRTLALVVDDLSLSFESTAHVRRALQKFVDEQMQPGDVAAIIRASAGLGALQQFTADKRLLAAAADRVRYSMMSRAGVASFGATGEAPGGNAAGENNIGEDVSRLDVLREDVFAVGTLGSIRFVLRALEELPGRKSVVLFSEGFRLYSFTGDNVRSEAALRALVEEANRASVAIYCVDARGLPTLSFAASDTTAPEGVQDARTTRLLETQDPLVLVAQETGGVFFGENDLSVGAARALEDQSGYYLIGYIPSERTDRPGRAHSFRPKVKRPGLTLRTRTTYYEARDEHPTPRPPQTSAEALQRAVTSPFSSGDIDLRLTSLFDHGQKQGSAMRTLLHIDGEDVTYAKRADGSSTAEVEIMAVTYGDKGEAVDQVATGSAIQVQAGAEEAVRKSGFVYTVNVPVKQPGLYQLRTAVRDRASGRVGSANQLIEVPDIKKGRLALSGLLLTGQAGAMREEGATVDRDPQASEAVRRFRLGTAASYGFVVYNARVEAGKPQLLSQIRIFREGQAVVSGKPKPVDPGPQTDMQRLIAGGALRFGPEMEPGDYVLQVTVTDALAKKDRAATQWIDFQIVP